MRKYLLLGSTVGTVVILRQSGKTFYSRFFFSHRIPPITRGPHFV